MTVQQVLERQPLTSFTTRDEVQDAGAVFTVTYVFIPIEGGKNATACFSCEPEEAWPHVEAIGRPAFETANQRLIEMLAARAASP